MPVPEITTPPPAPQPTDTEATFTERAGAFVAWMVAFVAELLVALGWIEDEANRAEAAANVAEANANFYGRWEDLSGPLAVPASVYHDSQYWILLEEIPDEVGDYEPGVSAVWGPGSGAVVSVAGKTGVVTLEKADVGLGNVDNTSDAGKPVSTAQAAAIAAKANAANGEHTGATTLQNAYVSARSTGRNDTTAGVPINVSLSNDHQRTVNGNVTISFTGAPTSGTVQRVSLLVIHISGVISWHESIVWPENTPPSLTAGREHVFVFETRNGTRWYGAALANYPAS